jgi:CRISPR-associated protein Csm2
MGQGKHGGGGYSKAPAFQPPSETEMRKIMVEGDPETLVAVAERVGQTLADQQLTTSQIRNVFGTVRQIQMRWPTNTVDVANDAYREAVLLRPKMAYFAERQKKAKGGKSEGMETLQRTLEPALKLLTDNDKPSRERFNRFVDLFEAIVAYHKKYGGRDS